MDTSLPIQLKFGIKTLRIESWTLHYGKLRIRLRNTTDAFPPIEGISVNYTEGPKNQRYALIRWITSDIQSHTKIIDRIHAEFKAILIKRLDDKYGFNETTAESEAFDRMLCEWEQTQI